jgi:hypothetical protein
MDVHQATTVVAVVDADGKIVLETIVVVKGGEIQILTFFDFLELRGRAAAYARPRRMPAN